MSSYAYNGRMSTFEDILQVEAVGCTYETLQSWEH